MKWSSLVILMLLIAALSYIALKETPEEKETIGAGTGLMDDWSEMDLRTVNEIHIKKDKQHFEFQKNLDGYWIMRRPTFNLADMLKIQQLFFSCCQPEVERELESSAEFDIKIKEEGIEIEIKNDKKSVKLDFFRLATHQKADFIRYHHRPDKIYKVNRRIDIDLNLNVDDFRTKRIFPFPLEAVNKMIYMHNGREVIFKRENGQFNFDTNYAAIFKDVLNKTKWPRAGCTGFINKKAEGKIIASYNFEFGSEQNAILNLYVDDDGHVLYYQGRDIGMRIDKGTKLLYFPDI